MAKEATPIRSMRIVGRRVPSVAPLVKPAPAGPAPAGDDTITDDDIEDFLAGTRTLGAETAGHPAAELSAGAYAVHHALAAALPESLAEPLAAGRTLCVVVRLPGAVWLPVVEVAAHAALTEVRARLGLEVLTGVVARGTTHSYSTRGRTFPVHGIAEDLRRRHVAVPVLPGEDLPSALAALADADVTLDLGPEAILAALRRRWPDASEWPEDLPADRLRPVHLDLVVKRAGSAPHAFDLLARLAEAAADEGKAEERAAEPKAKPSQDAYVPEILHPTSPRLDDLHGYGAAAAWGRDLLTDLAAYAAGEIRWSDVDAGCLLHGPPGTGKTLFASALAASSGLPFIATSYGQWQAHLDGHLGRVTSAIRQTFATANEAAPCLLFIDEFDAIAARGGSSSGLRTGDDWWSAIVAALLECLDGTARREGVVVMAACNHPDKLDPALVRSGRLDRRFEIGLPDEEALQRIFAHHLPGVDATAFEPAATALAGSISGADVSRLAREARRAARRARREMTADDLLALAMPPDTRSAEMRRLVAVHEAGHAVAIMAAGRVPASLSVVAGGGTHGGVRTQPDTGMVRLAEVEDEVVISLAGRAAEEVILGEPSGGAIYDLERATTIVRRAVGMLGLGGRLLHDASVDGHAVEARLRDLHGRTLRLIGRHRAAVEALADLATERRVLSRKALAAFAREHGFEMAR